MRSYYRLVILSVYRYIVRAYTLISSPGFVHSRTIVFEHLPYFFCVVIAARRTLAMAFVRAQRRTRCSKYCRCDELSPILQAELVTWNGGYWSWYHRRFPGPPKGVLFKFPREDAPRISRPTDVARGIYPVNSLYELAFKVSAMLCENYVRKTFSPNPRIMHWHYRQHKLAEVSLLCDYGLPPKYACCLLPQLNTQCSDPIEYPMTIHDNVTWEHANRTYDQYLRLRY